MKLKFNIGDRVRVRAFLRAEKEYDTPTGKVKREIVRSNQFNKPVNAVITGKSFRNEGTVLPGWGGGWDDYEGPEFDLIKRVPVWLVRRGMLNREEAVLEEDLELRADSEPIPYFHCLQPPVTESFRQEMREAAAEMPRDARGRFMKWSPSCPPTTTSNHPKHVS